MFSLNSANSVTKVFIIVAKEFEPATSCGRDNDASTAPTRQDLQIDSNPCFSDPPDSLNSLNSLNPCFI